MSNEPLRFVRVQEQLHDMKCDSEGNLTVVYDNTKERNTIHFTINSIVEDHSYGKFNYDTDGNFKGKVIIIADPDQMPTPAALNQVDTWFRYGLDQNTNERVLNVGKATLVIPEGMPAPENANILRYDGTEKHRNEVVEQHLNSLNIKKHSCLMRHWSDYGFTDSMNWAEDVAKNKYPNQNVFVGMHDGSIDSYLEQDFVRQKLKDLRSGERYFSRESGAEMLIVDEIETVNSKKIEKLEIFLSDLSSSERERVGLFYEKKIEQALSETKEAKKLNESIMYESHVNHLNKTVDSFPGEGQFYIGKLGATTPIIISAEQLKEMIINNDIKKDDKIWRSGYSSEWTIISKSHLRESIESINKPSSEINVENVNMLKINSPSLEIINNIEVTTSPFISTEALLQRTQSESVAQSITQMRSKFNKDLDYTVNSSMKPT